MFFWLKGIVLNQCKEEENWAIFRGVYLTNYKIDFFKIGM